MASVCGWRQSASGIRIRTLAESILSEAERIGLTQRSLMSIEVSGLACKAAGWYP